MKRIEGHELVEPVLGTMARFIKGGPEFSFFKEGESYGLRHRPSGEVFSIPVGYGDYGRIDKRYGVIMAPKIIAWMKTFGA